MKPCVPCRLLLALSLLTAVLGTRRASTEQVVGHHTTAEPEKNEDRLTCLRQDDLDLVKPMKPEYALRIIAPLSKEDTSSDIIVSLDKLWIKQVMMQFHFSRKSENTFAFTLGGYTEQEDPDDSPASLSFRVHGLDLLLKNYWIDVGASAAADREKMKEGQDGFIDLRLSGEGRVEWDDEINDWKVILAKKESRSFKIFFEGQWFLDKLVNAAHKIWKFDEQLVDKIWPLIEKAMPSSVATTINFLDERDFAANLKVTLAGKQDSMDEPLKLTVISGLQFNVAPVEMLTTLYDKCDPVAVAKQRMEHFLSHYGGSLLDMWEQNREVITSSLAKYGVKLDVLEKPLDQAGLEEMLLNAATTGADSLVQALKPFTDATARGERGLFQDLFALFEAHAGWDRAKNDGRVKLFVRPLPDERTNEVLKLPEKFLKCLNQEALNMVLPPKNNSPVASINYQGLTFNQGTLVCKAVTASGLRILAKGNESLNEPDRVWKLNATTGINVELPSFLDLGVGIDSDAAAVRLLHDGSFAVDLHEPVHLTEEPVPEHRHRKKDTNEKAKPALYKKRTGSTSSLDGAVPDDFERYVKEKADLSPAKLVEVAKSTTSVSLKGEENRVRLNVDVRGTFDLKAEEALAPFVTSQSTVDFGYMFTVGVFQRIVHNGESGVPEDSKVVAVLNCGYLRLLNMDMQGEAAPKDDPWRPVNFVPADGQLQLDVGRYLQEPDKVFFEGKHCLDLYSHYWPGPRTVSTALIFSTEVRELLCNEYPEILDNLRDSITLQIRRFGNDESITREWNYGTHDHEEGKESAIPYELPPGMQAVGLGDILTVAWGLQ